MRIRNLAVILAFAILAVLVTLVGCKKKEEPAAPTQAPAMEEAKEAATATAEEAKKTAETAAASVEQTMCPVMDGMKIDKNVFVEYKGKKVYFCCADCKAKFEADPEKYVANLPQFKQ